MVIVIILTAIASFFAGHIFGKWIIMLWLTKWNYKKKLFCNDCETGFTTTADEVKNYKFCPYCGKPLTYYYMDERYQKEIAIERPNQLKEEE